MDGLDLYLNLPGQMLCTVVGGPDQYLHLDLPVRCCVRLWGVCTCTLTYLGNFVYGDGWSRPVPGPTCAMLCTMMSGLDLYL